MGPFGTMLLIETLHTNRCSWVSVGNWSPVHVFFFIGSPPHSPFIVSGIGWGAHRERCPPAGKQHSVCRLRSVRQCHAGGPQHRHRPQLLHVGPCKFFTLQLNVSEIWASKCSETVIWREVRYRRPLLSSFHISCCSHCLLLHAFIAFGCFYLRRHPVNHSSVLHVSMKQSGMERTINPHKSLSCIIP